MTYLNADKLSQYLENLAVEMQNNDKQALFYPTKSALASKNYVINLIGHSNGGLVSRYYIENMANSKHVNSLITIDTPHWGSGWADVADTSVNLPTCYPMDIDLNPHRLIFGGTYHHYSTASLYVSEKAEYINSNQTDELLYQHKGNTKYCFLAGYDLRGANEIPDGYFGKEIAFDLNLNGISDFNQYKRKFKDSFIASKIYPELVNNRLFKLVFELKESDGDNVVNNQSQLGLKFNYHSGKLLKRIETEFQWINLDTFWGNWLKNHFHGQNQHRKATANKVIECLRNR